MRIPIVCSAVNRSSAILLLSLLTFSPFCRIFTLNIPETNHVPRGYTVAAYLSIHSLVLICFFPAQFFYVSNFRGMCAVPKIAAFCSSRTSWRPGMLLTYFLNYFKIVPVAPIITGIIIIIIILASERPQTTP